MGAAHSLNNGFDSRTFIPYSLGTTKGRETKDDRSDGGATSHGFCFSLESTERLKTGLRLGAVYLLYMVLI